MCHLFVAQIAFLHFDFVQVAVVAALIHCMVVEDDVVVVAAGAVNDAEWADVAEILVFDNQDRQMNSLDRELGLAVVAVE